MSAVDAPSSRSPSASQGGLDEMAPPVPSVYRPKNMSELWFAIKTFRPAESLKRLSTKECARNSLLVGMGGGAAVGVVRFAASRRINLAVSWSLGSFGLISGAAYIKCRQDKINRQQALREGVEKYMRDRGFVKTGTGITAPSDEVFAAEETVMITSPAQPNVPPPSSMDAPPSSSPPAQPQPNRRLI